METRYKLIAVGSMYEYYACTDGRIYKLTRKTAKESLLKGHLKNGVVTVKLDGKESSIKSLIAQAFIPGYKQRTVIINIDGNPWNNAVENLKLIPANEFHRITGEMVTTSQKVEVITPEGEKLVFNSIRKAAKELYVSYQTILDYMNNSYKSSVLDGYKFKKI